MRLLELVGSLALFIYIVVLIGFTSVNVSKLLFAAVQDRETHFWARQTTIFLWPLIILSEEGRKVLAVIWERENHDEESI